MCHLAALEVRAVGRLIPEVVARANKLLHFHAGGGTLPTRTNPERDGGGAQRDTRARTLKVHAAYCSYS
jgi:hypothetical protein